ncbi:dihydropteroate synthase, partial [Leucobacter soli]
MGIVNTTPDSFSDGGRFLGPDAAIAHGLELIAQGADIVDVGGESTRPGASPVPVEEEQRRVLPVIEALAAAGAVVSIDTIHAATARAAIAAGATIVNDVSGGLHDPDILRVAADSDATYIAMHWRGVPDPAHRRSEYADVVAEVRDDLARLAETARAAGISHERLVLDPGLGFDKTTAQGWQLLAGLPRLQELGYPVLVGVSRKRMVLETLASSSVSTAEPLAARGEVTMADRDLATAVVSALSAGVSAWGVRV